MPRRQSKRPREPSVVEEGPPTLNNSNDSRDSLLQSPLCCLELLPTEVIAKILEWVGKGIGEWSLAHARLVSRKWQQALGDLMERRARCRGSWYWSNAHLPRLGLLSAPYMSTTFLQGCWDLRLEIKAIDERLVDALLYFPYLGRLSLWKGEFTDAGAESLQRLEKLDSLTLCGQPSLSAAALKGIGGLKRLGCLRVEHCKNVDASGLTFLSGCPLLSVLQFQDCHKMDALMVALSRTRFKELSAVDVHSCHGLTEVGARHVLHMDGLKHVELSYSLGKSSSGHWLQYSAANQPLMELTENSSLEELRVEGDPICDLSLAGLAKLPWLRCLNLRTCFGFTNVGIRSLMLSPKLTRLNLRSVEIVSDDTLRALGYMRQLIDIDVSECKRITDNGVSFLATLNNLEILNASWCKLITDRGVVSLVTLPQLYKLDLRGLPQVTDACIAELKKMKNLRELNVLRCSGITNPGKMDLSNDYA